MLKAMLKILKLGKYKASKECTDTVEIPHVEIPHEEVPHKQREDNSIPLKRIFWFFSTINIYDCALTAWVF